MRRLAFVPIVLACACAGAALPARAQGTDGRDLAQKVLDEGARLFDKRDARAMAETYTDDAVLLVYARDANAPGKYKVEEHRGRGAIEDYYRKIYDGATEATVSKNAVEAARLISTDLMIVSGTFQPNVSSALSLGFTQIRVKVGDKWLKKELVLFIAP